jgi:glycosyltransferase involved in cell wall biosynthesis
MLAALRRRGIGVTTLRTDRRTNGAALRALHADVAMIDTIAAPAAAPLIRTLRANGASIVTLALMSRGAVRLARASDRVIAVGEALAGELRSAGIPRSRLSVIAPGTSRVRQARSARAVDPRPGTRGLRVLCVANWTRAKGIHTLVAAARRVPEISLDLVGAHPDAAYAARVRAEAAKPGLAGRVRVHGPLTGARLERMYRAAAIFALPSTLESYGMAVSEALAHGLPVVACAIASTRAVTGGAGLLVPPRRVGPLAVALRSLARDAGARDRLSERARARAASLPTWDRSERELVRAVLDAVSARGAGARRTRGGRPS